MKTPSAKGISNALWVLFLIWTAVGFVVMPIGWHPAAFRASDAIWMTLAAVNCYLAAVGAGGLVRARHEAALILGLAGAAELIGALTGVPFGRYVYTDGLGWRLGGVLPFTIPLAWLVVLAGGRFAIESWRPQATRLGRALGVAVLAVLTDVNLEPIASRERFYWIWLTPNASPPWQNYASWFALAFALSWLSSPDPRPRLRPISLRPVVALGLVNGLLLATHLGRWLRS